jgi:ATP-dependent RNA helicase DDX41
MELAKGIHYSEPLKSRYTFQCPIISPLIFYQSWSPPQYILDRTPEQNQKLCDKYHILTEGDNIPAPIEHFSVSNGRFMTFIWLTLPFRI